MKNKWSFYSFDTRNYIEKMQLVSYIGIAGLFQLSTYIMLNKSRQVSE